MSTATMRGEEVTPLTEDLEAVISEPGTAFDGQLFVNFRGPPAAGLQLRMGPRVGVDTRGLPFFEVHQPHPRGVEWATVEFPVAAIRGRVEIAFQARLLPQTPVHVKLYGEDLEHDIACVPMNHIVKRYRVPIDGDAVTATGGKDFRLGFCLPGGTWFVFQISGLIILPVEGDSAA